MAKIIPFRRRRWTRTRDYGRVAGPPAITARGLYRDTRGWLAVFRPFILGAILLSIWPAMDPALVEPPAFLATAPEQIDLQFTRCGFGRGYACVIDGDTFKLGDRKVRVVGIDTPEVDARCPEEAALAEQAAQQLTTLLNQGPFEMVGRIGNQRDRYGRDLRAIRRIGADGSVQSVADEMRKSGLARRYLGGLRGEWC